MKTKLLNEEVVIDWLSEISEKLTIIAYKLGVNSEDLHKYFFAETKEGNYTEEGKEALHDRLTNFLEKLEKIKTIQ